MAIIPTTKSRNYSMSVQRMFYAFANVLTFILCFES